MERSDRRSRKEARFYTPPRYNNAGNTSPRKKTTGLTVRSIQRALMSPEGAVMMLNLGLQPISPPPSGQRPRRSLEDLVTKAVDPNNPGVADLVLQECITPEALKLLTELVMDFRVKAPLGTVIDIDSTTDYVLGKLQQLHEVTGEATVDQLEAAAAKRAPTSETPAKPRTLPPPPAATFDDMLGEALKPSTATSLASMASPSHVKVLDTIHRAAHAALPPGSRWWSDAEYWNFMRTACITELDKLAPGHTAPSVAQLSAAADRLALPPAPNPPRSLPRNPHNVLYDGITAGDLEHLKGFDEQLRGVLGGALLDTGDDSDERRDRNASPRQAIPAQVPYKVSPTLFKRTAETEFINWISMKYIKYRNIAAKVFGKLGNGLGAECPDLMECLKDVHTYFKYDPVFMDHIYALGKAYKGEVAKYRDLVAKLDWEKGPHMFPPEQFDNAWLIHLEYCTSFLTAVQRTGMKTWGQIYVILYADYSEWADLPPATTDTVMCALKARNVYTTPINYNGKTELVTVPRPLTTAVAPTVLHDAAPTVTTPVVTKAPTPKAPKGNIAIAGVTVIPWHEVRDRKLCANCYGSHESHTCTVLCRRAICHPPWLSRAFDGHMRKSCKEK